MTQDDAVTVTGVAIMADTGKVFTLPPPARHHDVIRVMAAAGHTTPITGEQGFILSDGRFARRVAAKPYATLAGQILKGRGLLRELYSEDLW